MVQKILFQVFCQNQFYFFLLVSQKHNINQQAGEMKVDDCPVCTSENPQTKILLANLKSKIFKQSQEYVPDYQEAQTKNDQTQNFSRLLILTFGNKITTSHPSFLHCQHSKLTRYFRRKLKCDNRTLSCLCSEIASKIAEKNYQLQALCSQITSITGTSLKESINPQAEEVLKQMKERREIREKRKKERSTAQVINRAESEPNNQRNEYVWMSQSPPLMYFPWMFQGQYESN